MPRRTNVFMPPRVISFLMRALHYRRYLFDIGLRYFEIDIAAERTLFPPCWRSASFIGDYS